MATVTISASDGGTFNAYHATPPNGRGPGILLIQEIFGVNKVMRDLADGYAAAGYDVLCPDLFWRQEPGIDITDQSEAEWAKAFELFQGFDQDLGVKDLIATLDHLRGLESCNGKAGSVGFCLGGKLAYLMATRSDADCNVSYYGVGIESAIDEAARIKQPLLMHIAEKDQFVPAKAQKAIFDMATGNSHVEAHLYAGVDHAFARIGGAHYDEPSASLANGRTAAFFKNYLG